MKFSIIIPIYNVEKYLSACLNSVLSQAMDLYEIICINDGSTDGSLAVLEDYAKKYPQQIKVLSQENAGLSATRNNAVALAQGDYLLFLDSDDMFVENALQKLVSTVEVENPDIVAFNSELYYEANGKTEPNTSFNHTEKAVFASGMDFFNAFVALRRWGPSAVCFYAFRRDLFVKNNLKFEVGLLHEDELFMPQVLFFAQKTCVLPENLYLYRIHNQSITRAQKDKNYTDKLYIAGVLFDFLSVKKSRNLFVDRVIFNLSLAGIHGLMDSKPGRKKINHNARKILVNLRAYTVKTQPEQILRRIAICCVCLMRVCGLEHPPNCFCAVVQLNLPQWLSQEQNEQLKLPRGAKKRLKSSKL